MNSPHQPLGASFESSDASTPADFSPLPSSQSSYTPFHRTSPLTPLVCDRRAIQRLLETLLHRSGLSTREAGVRMGGSENSLRNYLKGRVGKPSLYWFVRLVEACGGRVLIEFPQGKV
jgi:hypothetical protein